MRHSTFATVLRAKLALATALERSYDPDVQLAYEALCLITNPTVAQVESLAVPVEEEAVDLY